MGRFSRTLNGRIILCLLTILLLSLFAISIHVHTVASYSRQQMIDARQRETAVYGAAMNASFSLLENSLFYYPSSNRFFEELLTYDSGKEGSSLDYWGAVTNIRRQLSTIQNVFPYVESCFAYYPNQELFLNEMANPDMTAYIHNLVLEESTSLQGGTSPYGSWIPIRLTQGSYLLRIYDMGQYCLGAWVDCDRLSSWVFSQQDMPARPRLYAATGEELSFHRMGDSLSPEALGRGEQRVSFFAVHPGIYLVRELESGRLINQNGFSGFSFAFVCLLHLAILLFIQAAFYGWVFKPVHLLSEAIQRIRSLELDYRISSPPSFSLEFAEINQAFNAMLDETQQMKIRFYEQQLEQDEVKLRYLSQQIQPHFILNSLNMLYSYVDRDAKVSRQLIRLLADYYRYIIHIESPVVEIQEEMAHLESYLSFQKIRYGQRLWYSISCPDEVKKAHIPPLVLESFVGNALKYGQDEEDVMKIEVRSEKNQDGSVCILIRDHGQGFPGEILDALQAYKATGQRDKLLGVGICNSLDRLGLIYGSKGTILFYNAHEGQGAVVEIRLGQTDDG